MFKNKGFKSPSYKLSYQLLTILKSCSTCVSPSPDRDGIALGVSLPEARANALLPRMDGFTTGQVSRPVVKKGETTGRGNPTTALFAIHYPLIKKLSPLLLLSICVGCGNSQADSKQTQVLLTPRSNLNAVIQAQTVEIHNDWNGYSDITPILRHYKLRLVNKDLVGNAHIAVGGYGASGIHQQRTTKVKIPAVTATKFLATLAKTPLQTGVYKPLIARKDDYPSIEIQLKIDKKQVVFSSKSQGVDQIPWQIAITENNTTKEYITNSPIPAQAFRILNSTLDRSGVDHIIHRRRVKKKK